MQEMRIDSVRGCELDEFYAEGYTGKKKSKFRLRCTSVHKREEVDQEYDYR